MLSYFYYPWTDLSEDTETIVRLVAPTGPDHGDGAGHLGGEHGAHGVPQPAHLAPPLPQTVAIVLQGVPAVALELAAEEQVRHPELDPEQDNVGQFT